MKPEPVESQDGTPVAPEHSKGSLDEPRGHSPFPVVGVGASAGGLEAFKQLLAHLPSDTGMAFVLVQHLDPHHESHLTELLAKATPMPVLEAVHGMPAQPDRVYVIPPNTSMAIQQGVLHLTPREETRVPHLPVDHLFRSLAEDQQGRAIAVVLSGTGSDGTLGLCEIKAAGGITFAQDEKSAKHAGMPHSAIDSGCVDFVLSPQGIAERLAEVGSHPYLASAGAAPRPRELDEDRLYHSILESVRAVTKVDFSLYRDTTIKRRIMRRMALHRQVSLADYSARLTSDRDEAEALYHDLLINVTSFFRDPGLFESMKIRVFPEIVSAKAPSAPVRVWVPGCSTGQEAYSLAISLVEFLDDRPVRPDIQIFATDIADQTTLARARAGVYLDTIEAEISPERLRRFFKREDHVYRIDKSIRDMCLFARQNVTSDPPFSHMDLISCRNVLIYLATPLQRRVLPAFHYALNIPGYLVLGSAENLGENADLFELVDRTDKIFAKRAVPHRVPHFFTGDRFKHVQGSTSTARRTGPPPLTPVDFEREADRVMLGRFAPPGVLVSEDLDILQFRGRTSPFLESPPGEPTINLLKMAREGLFLELRSALNEAKASHRAARRQNVQLRTDGSLRAIDLEVVPIAPRGEQNPCLLVLFHEPSSSDAAALPSQPIPLLEPSPRSGELTDGEEQTGLRQELAATKEFLNSLLEQQDAANEELRSANEEILSSNEELQSTNEELETAKEEVQSANEELTTVNEQLQHGNVELTQVNSDLTNLLTSTHIPVVIVGRDLRIRRFTAPAKKAMSLVPTDVHRPITDMKLAVIVPDLQSLIENVIETVQPVERDVRDRDGRWHALRIHPYRTLDHKIDGALVLLFDIDDAKRASELLRDADRRKDEFLATLAHELRNPIAPMRNAIEIVRLAGNDKDTLQRAHDLLSRQVMQLARIVDDMLDVSRIAERKLELKMQRTSLRRVVESAVEMCRGQIEACRHRLTVNTPREPLYVNVDSIRLTQVIVNLLNNSTKFTDPGGEICLIVERAHEKLLSMGDASRSPDEVSVSVRDNGRGIAPDLLPNVFEMFAQGKHGIGGREAGLGVGLALARSLVQLHGGRIEARSSGVGQGSEFVIRLPLSGESEGLAADSPAADAPIPPDQPKKILVVDDNHDLAYSLSLLLELMGHEVRVAEDGPSAVQTAAEFRPDVALVDLALPGLNGYEVARNLRADERHRNLVLVAQTGWGNADDRRRSAEAGFHYHLVKPVDPLQLRSLLASQPAASPSPRGAS